jgi:hypothetical protein
MLRAEAQAADWWDKLSETERKAYIKAHPKSKYAKTGMGISKNPQVKERIQKRGAAPVADKPADKPVEAPAKPAAAPVKPRKPRGPKAAKTVTAPVATPAIEAPKHATLDSVHAPRRKPSVRDTVREMFGMQRKSYASLKKLLRLEVAADKWWGGLSKKERQAYIKAHPKSRYAG